MSHTFSFWEGLFVEPRHATCVCQGQEEGAGSVEWLFHVGNCGRQESSSKQLRFLSLPKPSICSEAELPSSGRPVAHPISAWEAPSPPQQALNLQKEKKKEWGGGGEEKDVDTCSEEAKEFCLLLGAISAFCCGKDLHFTALLKHLQSLQI